jgi:hypothetical protein
MAFDPVAISTEELEFTHQIFTLTNPLYKLFVVSPILPEVLTPTPVDMIYLESSDVRKSTVQTDISKIAEEVSFSSVSPSISGSSDF